MRKGIRRTGFTIVELVIVIAVVAVLVAVLIPTFSNIINKANESAALQEATNAYKEYVVENAGSGNIENDLYVEVEEGYIHFVNGVAEKTDGKYVVTEIPDDAYIVPYTLAVFKLGENSAAEHYDTTIAVSEKTYYDGKYTLNIVSGEKVFPDSFDAKGNSCIKVGSSTVGSFSITVPEEVNGVSFCVAGYKAEASEIQVSTSNSAAVLAISDENTVTQRITTYSNDGIYTPITIDTKENKIVTFSTLADGKRCMINTIKYLKNVSSNNETPNEPDNDGLIKSTISFDNKSKRIAYDSLHQVWVDNNVVLVNNKNASTDDVKDEFNPVRIYKNSSLSVKTKNKDLISKIEVYCKDADHAGNLESALAEMANATITKEGQIVTIVLDTPTNNFEMVLTANAVHISKIVVGYTENTNSESHTCNTHIANVTAATCTTVGYTAGQYCDICYKVIVAQNEIPFKHNYEDGKCTLCDFADPDYSVSDDGAELLATFEFGENGSASHSDGSNLASSKTYNEDGYELVLTSMSNVYGSSDSSVTKDAKGNSCLKLGVKGEIGSLTFQVPENVNIVNVYVAQYKANTTKVNINDTIYVITTASDNGEYTKITIDTSINKEVTISTESDGKRCMVNTIEFKGEVLDTPTYNHTLCDECEGCLTDGCECGNKCMGHEVEEPETSIEILTATLKYTAGTTTNMVQDTNNAATVNLDATLFNVNTDTSGSNKIGLNKDGSIRLYANAGNGNHLTITIAEEYKIVGIAITLNNNNDATCAVLADGVEVTGADYVYACSAQTVVIYNNAVSGQFRMDQITISYAASTINEETPDTPELTDKEYSYDFSSKQFAANETKVLNDIGWTLAGDGGYWGYDGTKGQQFGSGSKPYKSMTLTSTTSFSKVTSIVINTSGASSINATLIITVGGVQIGGNITLTTTATEYTFESVTPLNGEVVLNYTQTSSKAIYIKSITVNYSE